MNITDINSTSLNPLERYWTTIRPFDNTPLLPPNQTPMRHLEPIELATPKFVFNEPGEGRVGVIWNTAARLRLFAERKSIHHWSLFTLARLVNSLYYPESHSAQMPLRGLEVLRQVDLLDETGIVISISSYDLTNRMEFRRVRLRDRIAELVT